jgi:hypothetical protein
MPFSLHQLLSLALRHRHCRFRLPAHRLNPKQRYHVTHHSGLTSSLIIKATEGLFGIGISHNEVMSSFSNQYISTIETGFIRGGPLRSPWVVYLHRLFTK